VIDYWIAVLERDPDSTGQVSCPSLPELTSEERQEVRRSHPLLALRPVVSATVLQLDRNWRAEMHRRVDKYVAALKSHR